MTDDLTRAMEALEREREEHRVEYDGADGTLYISAYDADAILAALREREQAIEQARADEREACAIVCIDEAVECHIQAEKGDALGIWTARRWSANACAAAIRARGER